MSQLSEILEIDPRVATKIDAVSDAIDRIATTAKQTAESFKTSFASMTGDAEGLRAKLESINNLFSNLGVDTSKGMTEGLNAMAGAARNVSTIITETASALGKFDASKATIADVTGRIAKLKETLQDTTIRLKPMDEQSLVNELAQLEQVKRERMSYNKERAESEAAANQAVINSSKAATAQQISDYNAIRTELLKLETEKIKMDMTMAGGTHTSQSTAYYQSISDRINILKKDMSDLEAMYPNLKQASDAAFDNTKLKAYSDASEAMYRKQEAAAKQAFNVEKQELRALEQDYLRILSIKNQMIVKGYDKAPSGTQELAIYKQIEALLTKREVEMNTLIAKNGELAQSADFERRVEEQKIALQQKQIELANDKAKAAANAAARDKANAESTMKSLESEYLRLQKMYDSLQLKSVKNGSSSGLEAKQMADISDRMSVILQEMTAVSQLYPSIINSNDYLLKSQQQQIEFEERKKKLIDDEAASVDARFQKELNTQQQLFSQKEQEVIRLQALEDKLKQQGWDKKPASSPEYQQWEAISQRVTKVKAEMADIDLKIQTMTAGSQRAVTNAEAQLRADTQRLEVNRKITAEQERQYRQTFTGATDYANAVLKGTVANTYDNRAAAVKNLEAAMKSLNAADANYQSQLSTLTAKHKELTAQQREVENHMKNIQNHMDRLTDLSGILGKAFSAVFALNYMKGFVDQLVTVRGELELQNTALASMLQSKERADKMFDKVAQLSVKSPFSIRQLTTYTKQLSAYQISYEELYGTMRRLADVSAGLGVDMQRLILAYGQVKAANYLRATEVRQFTEAGINMLGELAKYYSELEGKMVSVAEVQERVTKRMVMFEDVEEVFRRITDAGGLFYNMQEQQAQTMYGMWKNVKDRMTLMFNEMGEQYEGIIKSSIRVLGVLMSNYKQIIKVVEYIIVMLVAYKSGIIGAEAATTKKLVTMRMGFSSLGNAAKVAGAKITTAIKSINAAMLSAGWLIALTAVVDAIISATQWMIQYNKAIREATTTYNAHISQVEVIKAKYEELQAAAAEANAEDKEFADRNYKEKYAELQKLKELLDDAHLSFYTLSGDEFIKIDENAINASNIDNVFKASTEMYAKAQEFGREISVAITKGMQGAEGWFHVFGDNLKSDADDLSNMYSKISGGVTAKLKEMTDAAIAHKHEMREYSASLVSELERGAKEGESEIAWRKRQVELLEQVFNLNKQVREEVKHTGRVFRLFSNIKTTEDEAIREIDKVYKRMLKDFRGDAEKLNAYIQENPMAFKAALDSSIDAQDINEQAKELFADHLMLRFGIQIEAEDTGQAEAFLNDFQQQIKERQGGLSLFDNDREIKAITNYVQLVEALRKKYKEVKEKVEAITGLTDEAAKNELALLTTQMQGYEAMAQLYGINLETTKEHNQALKSANDILKERMDFLKDINKEYEENRKYMSDQRAQEFTISAFKDNDVFKALEKMGVVSKDMDLSSKGLIQALGMLKDTTATSKLKKQIDTLIGQLKNNEVIVNIKADMDKVKDDMEDAFGAYEFGKTISELGISAEDAKDIFGIDVIDLKKLQSTLEERKKAYIEANGELGGESLKMFNDLQNKIKDKRDKDLEERLKKYSNYLKKSYSEAVQIKLDEAKALADINELEANGLSKSMADVLRSGVREDATKKLDKNVWDQFRESDSYVEMFDNLEVVSTGVLDNLLGKLEEMRSSLTNLEPHSLREIQNQYNKIQEELMSRDGWGAAWKNYKDYRDKVNALKREGKTEDKVQMELFDAEQQSAKLKEYEDILQGVLNNEELRGEYAQTLVNINGQMVAVGSLNREQLAAAVTELQRQRKEQDGVAAKARETLTLYKGFKLSAKNAAAAWQNIMDVFSKMKESVMQVVDAMGLIEEDSPEQVYVDMSMQLLEMVGNMVLYTLQTEAATVAAEGLGVAINTAMGPVGWILMAIEAIAAVLTGIINAKNKKFQQQMEQQKKLVDDLNKAYSNLEEKIENAYSINRLRAYNAEAERNLRLTIETAKANAALYNAKKDTKKNREAKEEWLEYAEEAEKSMKELKENLTESLGGFGSAANLKSAAEDFVDAWHSAFMETGDGLSGLEEQMDEFIQNAVKRQLLLRLSEQYIQPVLESFDQMFDKMSDGGDIMTEQELAMWKEKYNAAAEEFNDRAQSIIKELGAADTGAEGMTGLAEGIQGVTEQTAELVAAITESIRYYVADTNLLLHNWELMFTNPADMQNPWYEEMVSQTNYLRQIRDAISSVTTTAGLNQALRVQIV